MILESFSSIGDAVHSPFIVPVAGCFMILGIVAVTSWSSARTRELESQERLAAIAKGLVPPPTAAELALSQTPRPAANAFRRRGNVRLTGIILLSSAVALALFFVVLWLVLGVREILSGVACALIPFGIGVGFLIDTRIQSQEIDEASAPPNTPPSHSF